MPEPVTGRYDEDDVTKQHKFKLFKNQNYSVCVCVFLCMVRLSMGPLWRMLGGESVSDMSRAAWRTQLDLCTCMKPLLEKANKW